MGCGNSKNKKLLMEEQELEGSYNEAEGGFNESWLREYALERREVSKNHPNYTFIQDRKIQIVANN